MSLVTSVLCYHRRGDVYMCPMLVRVMFIPLYHTVSQSCPFTCTSTFTFIFIHTPLTYTHVLHSLHTQLGGRSKKKLRHPKASEPQPPDPELDRKMQELERMTDAQINDKLQAMLVSGGIFSNISYYIMMM